jgi:hypothetical protein
MNNDIGFILIKLQNDAFHDAILQTIKQIEQHNIYGQTVLFNSFSEKVETYDLPILHLSQSQFFHGKLFIFDLPSIILTQKFPNITQRILYTNMIPWSGSPKTAYREWESIYKQPSLDILCGSQKTYDAYELCWKKPIGVSERFNYEEVKDYI